MTKRRFSEINPTTFKIAVQKNKVQRNISDILDRNIYCRRKSRTNQPVVIYRHQSMIRRKLGHVDQELQENKAVNLSIAAPAVDGILIGPGETFSFWRLVGDCTARKGYLPGLMIKAGETGQGIGGGMCQFTNLIHWMVLHSPLKIVEHHHHGTVDMFPDHKRQIPFGTGTSILHNYKDYRFTNHSQATYQLRIWVEGDYLYGELRASETPEFSYKIVEENAYFDLCGGDYYRHNEVYREIIERSSGLRYEKELIMKNKAKVLYDPSFIPQDKLQIGA